MQAVIRARKLRKVYQMGDVQVEPLKGIDLDLFGGELVVVLGPSGSGKTTLLNIIGGMDQATSGELYYRDQALHRVDARQLTFYRRNQVGFVFQFYNLIPNLTAYENVDLAAQIAKNPLSVDELLEKVGLGDRKEHFPSQLSGGEQQRVAIARALVKNPEMILCDEPTGALDFQTSIQVLQLLADSCRLYGKTVVIITHNTAIAPIAQRIFHLKDGVIDKVEVNRHPISPEEVRW